MRSWNRFLPVARTGALAVALIAPVAASADIFAWRTEDGVYAYTDDKDNIPARYADEAVAVRDSRLSGYSRLTVEDSAATRGVAARLEKRLDYLRQVNGPAPIAAGVAAAGPNPGKVISVATGSAQVPTLQIPAEASDEPIIVEPVLTRQSSRVRTRRATLVKQGDRLVAVVQGRSHEIDINDDILDEDRLIAGEE